MRRLAIDAGARRTRGVLVLGGELIEYDQLDASGWKSGRIVDRALASATIETLIRRHAGPRDAVRLGFDGQDDGDLRALVEDLGFRNYEIVYEPVAASKAVLEDFGSVALVDIGAQGSGLVVWRDGEVEIARRIPIGGDHFSRDAAHVLSVPFATAHQLKEEVGHALAALDQEETPLNVALEARAEEFAVYVNRELIERPLEIVLVGGGSALNGLADVVERICKVPARVGYPVGGWPAELQSPEWATAIGLALN